MANLRSHQLYCGDVTGTGPFSLYTVPSGKLVVLKAITLQNMGSGSPEVEVYVASVMDLWNVTLGPVGSDDSNKRWYHWLALTAGQELKLLGSSGVTLGVNLSGYLYYV